MGTEKVAKFTDFLKCQFKSSLKVCIRYDDLYFTNVLISFSGHSLFKRHFSHEKPKMGKISLKMELKSAKMKIFFSISLIL